jgi:O-antigen ligase
MVFFFSFAQPATLFPALEVYRPFFVLTGLSILLLLLKRSSSPDEFVSLPQNRYIYGILIAYTLSEAQYFWLKGMLDVFLVWFKTIILYWMLINVNRNIRDLKRLIWILIVAVSVLIYLGWDLYLNDPTMLCEPERLNTCCDYNNPNSFALILTVAFPLAYSLLQIEVLPKKLLLFTFLIALFISCVYTKSRGGLAGMTMATLLSIINSRRLVTSRLVKTVLVASTILVFAGAIVSFVLTRGDVTSYLGSGGEASAGDRLMAWRAAIRMFMDHPLFGIGWGKFIENSLDYGMDKRLLAHNTMLSVLAETGIFGFTCYMAILILALKQLWRIRQSWLLRPERIEGLILCEGVLISFLSFLINTSFSVKDHDPIYWAILALAGILCSIYIREQGGESSP